MKIAIITVYNSPNFGSNWQARALYTFLDNLGHEVYMFDTGARSVWERISKPATLSIIKSFLTLKVRKGLFQYDKLKAYKGNFRALNIISDMNFLNSCDAVIIGSDEIWNVKREEMKSYPIFFGKDVVTPIKMSYAVSVNNADKSDLDQFGMKQYLQSFTDISVRDLWSREQLHSLTERSISIVLDPTFLLDRKFYSSLPVKNVGKGYIGVYLFNPDRTTIAWVKEIGRITGKKLLSIGTWYEWCDECAVGENPFVYYFNSDFVITNTFHGTAYAINFNRPFVSFTSGKRKIQELLNMFELGWCQADGKSSKEIAQMVTDCTFDWESINTTLLRSKEASTRFIYEALGERINP